MKFLSFAAAVTVGAIVLSGCQGNGSITQGPAAALAPLSTARPSISTEAVAGFGTVWSIEQQARFEDVQGGFIVGVHATRTEAPRTLPVIAGAVEIVLSGFAKTSHGVPLMINNLVIPIDTMQIDAAGAHVRTMPFINIPFGGPEMIAVIDVSTRVAQGADRILIYAATPPYAEIGSTGPLRDLDPVSVTTIIGRRNL